MRFFFHFPLIQGNRMPVNSHNPSCTCLASMAERELAAFVSAVAELYAPEQARVAAEHWIAEFQSMDGLPGSTSGEWRLITIAAAARLASRLIDLGHQANKHAGEDFVIDPETMASTPPGV